MKTTYLKKILAREFLIFISILTLSLLSFPITYGYNVYLNKEVKNIQDSITNTPKLWIDNYSNAQSVYIYKTNVQEHYFKVASEFYSNVGEGKKFSTYETLWNQDLAGLNNGSFNYKKFKDFFFYFNNNPYWQSFSFINNQTDLQNFFKNNTISNLDKLNYELGIENESTRIKMNYNISSIESKKLNESRQIKVSINVFIILTAIFFVLRYLILTIKWSIKVLKA